MWEAGRVLDGREGKSGDWEGKVWLCPTVTIRETDKAYCVIIAHHVSSNNTCGHNSNEHISYPLHLTFYPLPVTQFLTIDIYIYILDFRTVE